ncbi:PQQ-dependent sugar dehydrogenase [Roseococcus sp.]|uniref:PQQ-dependent sugar dehydrogenase n=1 Tax=Roseococcus sp. TaxID=2109646 RepID=UPI003BAA68DC
MPLRRRSLLAAALPLPLALAVPAVARAQGTETVPSQRGPLRLRTFATGLEHPWGGGFLPDGRLLISERPGRARLISRDGQVSASLAGLPEVEASGQGGLLDLRPAPDFAATSEVFFAAATLVQGGALTRLYRARLGPDGFTEVRAVVDAAPAQSRGRNHYGGRIAFSPDGAHVFLTCGDRYNERERAQRLDDLAGKVLRLTRDGRIPRDNPFVGMAGHRGEIWTYGHRNPQGIAFNPATGSLFAAEFGPLGGDELNLLRPGQNYGWPEVSYGREYSGRPIANGRTSGPGIAEPVKYWVPAVSPSGLAFAPADAPPAWRGGLFMACLNPAGLIRMEMEGDRVVAEERLLWGQARLRQVIFAPDGGLLLLTDEARGRILRLDAA